MTRLESADETATVNPRKSQLPGGATGLQWRLEFMPWKDECLSFLQSIQLAAQFDTLHGHPKKPQRIILHTN